MRIGMLLFGLALGILWIVGLSQHATPWLMWADFVVAVLSLIAAVVPLNALTGATGTARTGDSTTGLLRGDMLRGDPLRAPPLALSAVLLVLWIIGLATGASAFMTWWTLAFAVAYGLLGVFTTRTLGAMSSTTTGFPGTRRI